jgi:hypothetical protein
MITWNRVMEKATLGRKKLTLVPDMNSVEFASSPVSATNPQAGLLDVVLPRATLASFVVDARPLRLSADHASLHIIPYVTPNLDF